MVELIGFKLNFCLSISPSFSRPLDSSQIIKSQFMFKQLKTFGNITSISLQSMLIIFLFHLSQHGESNDPSPIVIFFILFLFFTSLCFHSSLLPRPFPW